MAAHEDRGEDDPDDGRHDRGHDERPAVRPTMGSSTSGTATRRIPSATGAASHEDPEQAHHPQRLVAGRSGSGPAGGTVGDATVVAAGRSGRRVARCYTPPVLDRSGCHPPTRRSTIALEGRIGRPVRRPGDQPPAIRRRIGGATRERSIRVPGHSARGPFVLPALTAHPSHALMPATVIVGLQWGDEGKGKTTDFLAEQTAMVVRYQGGDNAGHTVVSGDEVFKLQLTPSGVLYPHITSVIGNGVVVNPVTLIAELDMLTARGHRRRAASGSAAAPT